MTSSVAGRRPAFDVISHSPDQTRHIGFHLGKLSQPGDVYLLDGQIGAGKTTLVQGLALGLGVAGPVQSPTFTLAVEYAARLPDGRAVHLYHLDLYRLADESDLATFGYEEYFDDPEGIVVVEWPSRLVEALAAPYLVIGLRHVADSKRRVFFTPWGKRFETLVNVLRVELFGERHSRVRARD